MTTTPGYKKCTLCGEEMIIDAILCPHCGEIPGRGKPPPPPAFAPGRRKPPRMVGMAMGFASVVLIAAGVAGSDSTLILAGAVALALTVGLLLWARGPD